MGNKILIVMYQPISLDGLIFYDIGNTAGFRISVYHKNIDRTEAVCIYAVEAARCGQDFFLFVLTQVNREREGKPC